MPDQTIGLISDTHGLLRDEAIDALQGVSLIIHAGDVGDDDILDRLRVIAPVVAVRGNMDRDSWCMDLPVTTTAEVGDLVFYVVHDLMWLDVNPQSAGVTAIITGHTHLPAMREKNGVHYFNPGSAGPRRRGKPCTLMLLHVENGELRPDLVELEK